MEIFSLLKKKGLVDEFSIKNKIMDKWSMTDILSFNEELDSLIKPINEITSKELPNYQFIVNADLGGQDYGVCSGTGCRMARVEELRHFSTLWADKVYLHSYFDNHKILSESNGISKSQISEIRFKLDYSTHILCLLKLQPLIEKGIIEIYNGSSWVCPTCMAEKIDKCEDIQKSLLKYEGVLSNDYREKTSATIKRENIKNKEIYILKMSVPEVLNPHKTINYILTQLPECLKGKKLSMTEAYAINKYDLKKMGIPNKLIHDQVNSVMFSQILSTLQGLKASFMTNSQLEVDLLNYISNNDVHINHNEIIQRELSCDIPLILGVSPEYLLEIREKDHEAFLVYRDSITMAINEYLSKGLNIKDTRQLYGDIIQPKLNLLNLQIKSIKDRAWRNLKTDVTILVTCGVFGFLSNLLAFQIPLFTASGISILDIVKNLKSSISTPEEAKTDSFYFLWKASKNDVKLHKK